MYRQFWVCCFVHSELCPLSSAERRDFVQPDHLNESCHINTELNLDKKQFSCTMAISNISGLSCDHRQIIICHSVTPALSSKAFSWDCEVFVRIRNGQNSTCGFWYLHYFALCFAVFLGMTLQLQGCVFDVYCPVYKHFE